MTILKKLDACPIASYILATVFLLVVMLKGLLGALFAGLLVYSLVHLIAPRISGRLSDSRARAVAAGVIGIVIVALLTLTIWGIVVLLKIDAASITGLFKKMADILDASRAQIPAWISERLPVDAESLREMLTGLLREHAADAKNMGAQAGKTLVHILLGMIIGVMVSLHADEPLQQRRPLAAALRERVIRLAQAFRDIVFAQVWISGINTVITAVFVFIVLPLFGVSLPLAKTLVAITFLAGLMPVIGNLISNSVLVVLALSISLQTALAALSFMIVLHKLEYFLNARIIGAHINARAWELLVAMLVAETVFGLPGVIAAPVLYAYAKKELTIRELI
ncbi:MAG: AI-2E family transporter [Pseudomonadota bacterium]